MKKIFLTLILSVIMFSAIFAQAPQGINYQAVARNSAGGLLSNSSISLRISILDKTATGTSVFTETHSVTTNALGLFTFMIGKGTLVSGDFTKIDWSTNDKFLEVEMDSSGGSSYTVMGTSQLVSVPYALYADKAGNAKTYNAGSGISISNDSIINTSQDQKVNLTGTGGTSISGTYPSFTIKSTVYNAGKGISISNDSIINTAPDQKVTINGGGASAITGSYPNFTVSSSDSTMWKRNGASNIYYNGGNVGIGTLNPLSPMDVNGTGTFRSAKVALANGIGSYVRIGYDTTNSWGFIGSDNSKAGYRQLRIESNPMHLNPTSKGNIYMVDGGGKVGIGTTSPFATLQVKGDWNNSDGAISIDGDKPTIRFNSSQGTNKNSKWLIHVGGSGNGGGMEFFHGYDGGNWGTPWGTPTLFLDTTSNVGIGTHSPYGKLDVLGNIYTSNHGNDTDHHSTLNRGATRMGMLTAGFTVGPGCGPEFTGMEYQVEAYSCGNGSLIKFYTWGCNAGCSREIARFDEKGDLGIGTTSPSEKLSVSGNICYTGSIGSCSDRRYKTNILSMGSMLSNIMALAPVTYNWRVKEFPDKNFNDKKQLGFIAQDIEKIFPELVLTDQDGYKSVDYVKITPILVKAVQEQQNEIKEQQSQIEELEKQTTAILKRLNSIDAGQNKSTAQLK